LATNEETHPLLGGAVYNFIYRLEKFNGYLDFMVFFSSFTLFSEKVCLTLEQRWRDVFLSKI
jgi:hypothetical protein